MTLRKTSGISWTCQSTTNYLKGATIVIQNIEKLANMSKIDVVSQTSVYCVAEISSCLVTSQLGDVCEHRVCNELCYKLFYF